MTRTLTMLMVVAALVLAPAVHASVNGPVQVTDVPCPTELDDVLDAIMADQDAIRELERYGSCIADEFQEGIVCLVGHEWELADSDELLGRVWQLGEAKDLFVYADIFSDNVQQTYLLPLVVTPGENQCNSPGGYGWSWQIGEPMPVKEVAAWYTTLP